MHGAAELVQHPGGYIATQTQDPLTFLRCHPPSRKRSKGGCPGKSCPPSPRPGNRSRRRAADCVCWPMRTGSHSAGTRTPPARQLQQVLPARLLGRESSFQLDEVSGVVLLHAPNHNILWLLESTKYPIDTNSPVQCECPTFFGPFQVGEWDVEVDRKFDIECNMGSGGEKRDRGRDKDRDKVYKDFRQGDNVWSASYHPYNYTSPRRLPSQTPEK